MQIQGVFFDFHDTLTVCDDPVAAWDEWSLTLYGVLHEHGSPLPEEAFRHRCARLMEGPEPPRHNGLTIYECRIGAFCREMGWCPDEGAIRTAAAASVAAWLRYFRLDEEAVPLLQWLRPRAGLALVSNFDHPQAVHALIEAWGLKDLFHKVVVSGDIGVCKPDPAIYRHALDALGLEAGTVAFVGDSDADVAGAKAAGCRPVRIVRHPAACAASSNGVLTIQRLSEIPGLLFSRVAV
jgi:HAD superfamily hydrolase (TIGR01509 family)